MNETSEQSPELNPPFDSGTVGADASGLDSEFAGVDTQDNQELVGKGE